MVFGLREMRNADGQAGISHVQFVHNGLRLNRCGAKMTLDGFPESFGQFFAHPIGPADLRRQGMRDRLPMD